MPFFRRSNDRKGKANAVGVSEAGGKIEAPAVSEQKKRSKSQKTTEFRSPN